MSQKSLQTAPLCTGELSFTDLDAAGVSVTLRNDDLTISENNITFTTEQLAVNYRYSVTITTRNIHGIGVSGTFLSEFCYQSMDYVIDYCINYREGTHGVEAANIAYVGQDEIRITISYSRFSFESGVLVSLISDGASPNVVNFTRSVTLTLDRNTSLDYVLPFELFPGSYRMFIYDIEQDGTLRNGVGYPAFTGEIQIRSNSQGMMHVFSLFIA